MTDSNAHFGAACLRLLRAQPFGSLSKREIELGLLQAAIDAGLLPGDPAQLAANLHLTLTKSNAYLTELALRRSPLADAEAIARLIALLPDVEVLPNDRHFSLPLHDADLRIWLERKLAGNHLHPGESLRRDVVKLTPAGLLRLLDHSNGMPTPLQALDSLEVLLDAPQWVMDAKTNWSDRTTWRDTLSTFGNISTVMQALQSMLCTWMGR